MNTRCKFCIDPECGGANNCDCASCAKRDCCHRTLRPTIRITRRCTQSCQHCCWSCDPKQTDHMSLDVARATSAFLEAHNIILIQIMGGEFWMHPRWRQVVSTLVEHVGDARIVTNGDWAARPRVARSVMEFMQEHPQCRLGISKDSWHTNEHIERAAELCEKHGIFYKVDSPDSDKTPFTGAMVPIGRHRFEICGFYGSWGAYCQNPNHKYSLLVDHEGDVSKCPFGPWPLGNVSEYTEPESFYPEFKDFGTRFQKACVMTCAQCLRAWDVVKRKEAPREREEDNHLSAM